MRGPDPSRLQPPGSSAAVTFLPRALLPGAPASGVTLNSPACAEEGRPEPRAVSAAPCPGAALPASSTQRSSFAGEKPGLCSPTCREEGGGGVCYGLASRRPSAPCHHAWMGGQRKRPLQASWPPPPLPAPPVTLGWGFLLLSSGRFGDLQAACPHLPSSLARWGLW